MDGVAKQVLTIIGILKGIRTEELASIMIVPSKYIEEVCQSLLDDELITRTPHRGGFALKPEARNEVLELIADLKVAYIGEIGNRLAISPEAASHLCASLLREGLLHKTSRGGYVLEEDRERVLRVIRQAGRTTAEEIGKKMHVSEAYAELLCKSLTADCFILQTSNGEYVPSEKDVSSLLRLVRKDECVSIGRIAHQMGITSAYARLLCSSLIKQGYLRRTHQGGCSLARV